MQRRSVLKLFASTTIIAAANSLAASNLLPALDELTFSQVYGLIHKYRNNDAMLLVIHDKIYEMKDDLKCYAILKGFKESDARELYLYQAAISTNSKYGNKAAYRRIVAVPNSLAEQYRNGEFTQQQFGLVKQATKLANQILT